VRQSGAADLHAQSSASGVPRRHAAQRDHYRAREREHPLRRPLVAAAWRHTNARRSLSLPPVVHGRSNRTYVRGRGHDLADDLTPRSFALFLDDGRRLRISRPARVLFAAGGWSRAHTTTCCDRPSHGALDDDRPRCAVAPPQRHGRSGGAQRRADLAANLRDRIASSDIALVEASLRASAAPSPRARGYGNAAYVRKTPSRRLRRTVRRVRTATRRSSMPNDELLALIERRVSCRRARRDRAAVAVHDLQRRRGCALAPATNRSPPVARTRRARTRAPRPRPALAATRWPSGRGLMLRCRLSSPPRAGVAVCGDSHAAPASRSGQPVVIGDWDSASLAICAASPACTGVRVGGDDGLAADGIEVRLSLTALAARTCRSSASGSSPVITSAAPRPQAASAHAGHIGGANAVAAALGTAPSRSSRYPGRDCRHGAADRASAGR